MKTKTDFQITYPLTCKAIRNLKIVTEHVGDLVITGVVYCNPSVPKIEVDERYSMDIDFVKWNGMDIKPVLEATDGMDDIEEYCFSRAADFFTKEARVA